MKDPLPQHFQAWLAAQSAEIKLQVEAKQAEIAQAPDIAHTHPTGRYARLARLLEFCTETLGYQAAAQEKPI